MAYCSDLPSLIAQQSKACVRSRSDRLGTAKRPQVEASNLSWMLCLVNVSRIRNSPG